MGSTALLTQLVAHISCVFAQQAQHHHDKNHQQASGNLHDQPLTAHVWLAVGDIDQRQVAQK